MEKILNSVEIKNYIQAAPYILVDRIQFSGDLCSFKALKNVTANENYFQGHFPGNPIMPGVLQLETMFQAATVSFKIQNNTNALTRITNVKKMKFRNPVLPGDQLILDINIIEINAQSATVKAVGKVGDKTCSMVEFTMGIMQEEELQPKEFISEYTLPEDPIVDDMYLASSGIQNFIPHRYPFLLIDKILHRTDDDHIIGQKCMSANEPWAAGMSYVPNTLLIESLAQLGCVYMLSLDKNLGKLALFLSIENAAFKQPVIPGDIVTFVINELFQKSNLGKCNGSIYVGDTLISDLTFAFAIVDKQE